MAIVPKPDWAKVDFRRPWAELMQELGVSKDTIWRASTIYGKSRRPRDWSKVNLAGNAAKVAERLGISKSHLRLLRRQQRTEWRPPAA